MIAKLSKYIPRLQNIKLLPNEKTLASGLDTIHNRTVLLKELSLYSGARTVYNHLWCQNLGLYAPTMYHCHNFNEMVVIECEYLPGKDLFYRLNKNQESLPVMSIMKQLLSYIESYQNNNLSHLDIKLENIIWNSQTEKLYIIDFESMRTHSTDSTSLENPIGTLCYMSPEMFHKSVFHRNTDLWNAGIVGYILSTRCNPLYDGAMDRNDLQRYARRELYNTGVDSDLSLIITSLLHPNPEYRSANSKQVLMEKPTPCI